MLAGVGGSSPARADAGGVGLNWVRLPGAESCIAAAELARRVEARLGRAVFGTTGDASAFVDGHVQQSGPHRWRVVLELSSPRGAVLGRRELEFEGEDCSAIDEPVILVVSVTLDPARGPHSGADSLAPGLSASLDALFGDESSDPSPEQLPVPQPAAASQATPTVTPGSPIRPRHPPPLRAPDPLPWQIALDAGGLASLGRLPHAAAGWFVHAQFRSVFGWPLALAFSQWLSQRSPLVLDGASTLAGDASFSLNAVSVALCPMLGESSRLRVEICSGLELAFLSVSPHFTLIENFNDEPDVQLYVLAAPTLHVSLFSGLYLRFAASARLAPFARSYIVHVEGADNELFRPPVVSSQIELGLGWRFALF